jgi:chromosome segregation ATPase
MVFIGKSINPVENVNVMETITPLWLDKTLSQNEKALTYTCAVLNNNIAILTDTIYDLQKQIKELKEIQNGGKLNNTEKSVSNVNTNLDRKRLSKKSSKRRIKEINRSIKDVKNTLNEIKKYSKK